MWKIYTLLSKFLSIGHGCYEVLYFCISSKFGVFFGSIVKYTFYSTRNDDKINILYLVENIYFIHTSSNLSTMFKESYFYQFP